jgi:hypothetical protein
MATHKIEHLAIRRSGASEIVCACGWTAVTPADWRKDEARAAMRAHKEESK